MPSVKSVLAASAVAFFTSANAHMILLTPPPYGSPNSSPLDASGSDFPCKGATSISGGTVTNMAIGSQQQLSFKGSAVHGGGSCQVSLTKDQPATKNSKWMVIHSIVGGCPAKAAGNLPENPNGNGADKFSYTIPQGVDPGKYTLAWTWFNRIGNREMYMNCAAIQVTGGSKKRDMSLNETYAIPELSERATPNFPAMFVANVPTTDCKTTDSMDLQFPSPGSSVEKAGSGQLAPPTGPKCGSAGTQAATSGGSTGGSSSGASSGDAAGGSGSGTAPSAAAGGSSAAPSAAAGTSSGTDSGSGAPDSQTNAAGGSSSGSSGSAGGSAAPSAGGAPAAGAPAASGAASGGSTSGSSGSSSSGSTSGGAAPAAGGAATGSCSQPGQSICSPDGKQIGTCTSSKTVTWIPVAAGTKCSGGIMVMAGSKRSARFPSNYKYGQ